MNRPRGAGSSYLTVPPVRVMVGAVLLAAISVRCVSTTPSPVVPRTCRALPPLVARFPRAVLTRASFPRLQVGASGWSSYKPGSVVAPRLRWLCREAEQQPLPVVDSTLVHS